MPTHCPNTKAHEHHFGQAQHRPQENRVRIVTALTLATMFAEIATGIWSGSMALLADGVHMGTHAMALGLAAISYAYARTHALDRRFSFGTGKVGELAGFSSALLLSFSAFLLCIESVERLLHPRDIVYAQTLIVAVIGLGINLLSAVLLGNHSHGEHESEHEHAHEQEHEHDHNLKAAFVHVLADALTSVAAIVAIAAAWKLGWNWLDPLVAIAASVVIFIWGIGLLKDTGKILLDTEAPAHERDEIRAAFESDGDSQVSDLHLWAIGPGAWTLVATVVTHQELDPDDYKKRLPSDLVIHHPIIEVVHCGACRQ